MEEIVRTNNSMLQLVAFQGEEFLSKHSGTLEMNQKIATDLDADVFSIIDPKNPSKRLIGERESPDYIEWEEVMLH